MHQLGIALFRLGAMSLECHLQTVEMLQHPFIAFRFEDGFGSPAVNELVRSLVGLQTIPVVVDMFFPFTKRAFHIDTCTHIHHKQAVVTFSVAGISMVIT